jgi:hypothetical protein
MPGCLVYTQLHLAALPCWYERINIARLQFSTFCHVVSERARATRCAAKCTRAPVRRCTFARYLPAGCVTDPFRQAWRERSAGRNLSSPEVPASKLDPQPGTPSQRTHSGANRARHQEIYSASQSLQLSRLVVDANGQLSCYPCECFCRVAYSKRKVHIQRCEEGMRNLKTMVTASSTFTI